MKTNIIVAGALLGYTNAIYYTDGQLVIDGIIHGALGRSVSDYDIPRCLSNAD
jgi:hypothetical protein